MERLRDVPSTTDDWPIWTDADTWELNPDPDEVRWWAERNDSWDANESVPDEVYDRRADEAKARDLHERGLLPL